MTTSRELAHRIVSIQDGLKLEELQQDNKLVELLLETRKMDEISIEKILKNEGYTVTHDEFVYSIENEFIKAKVLRTIREYKEESTEEWDFLNKDEQSIIYNTIKLLKKTKLEYRLNRVEIIIMRKEIIDFIQDRLKSIKSNLTPQELINIIINNYTYIDTLNELDFIKEGDILMNYFLDEDLIYRLK